MNAGSEVWETEPVIDIVQGLDVAQPPPSLAWKQKQKSHRCRHHATTSNSKAAKIASQAADYPPPSANIGAKEQLL
jgi:hypothetical protein